MALDLSAEEAATVHRALWKAMKRVRGGDSLSMVEVDGMFRSVLSGDRTLIDKARRAVHDAQAENDTREL